MDFYKFWQILENSSKDWRNHPDMANHYWSPEEEDNGSQEVAGRKELELPLIIRDGKFHDEKKGLHLPALDPYVNSLEGATDDKYVLRLELLLSAWAIWNDRWERMEISDSQHPDLEVEWAMLTNNTNSKEIEVNKDHALTLFSPEGYNDNTPYKVDYDLIGDDLNLSVR